MQVISLCPAHSVLPVLGIDANSFTCRYEKVEALKQEARRKKELEKRLRKKDGGGDGADGALEKLTDGASSDESDSDDEMKLKEEEIAGAVPQHSLFLASKCIFFSENLHFFLLAGCQVQQMCCMLPQQRQQQQKHIVCRRFELWTSFQMFWVFRVELCCGLQDSARWRSVSARRAVARLVPCGTCVSGRTRPSTC